MKLMNNREIKKSLAIYGIITAISTIAAFLMGKKAGIVVFFICVMFTAVFILTSYYRYKRLFSYSDDINRMLHGETDISFDEYDEGELSVLNTELKKMTSRLITQSERLKEDKLYLSNSLADISHQLRTPLTSMNLIASFISAETLSDERRLELAGELKMLLRQFDRLISSLLKMSKLDAGSVTFNPEAVSLKQLIDISVKPLLIPIELNEQRLIINSEGSFYGDVMWTSEAIGNILKNCMEHTPHGGTLEISAHETPLYSEIIISDNGSGIDEEDLPHIFERFYRGKNASPQSIGIGLALARSVIASQDGTVKVANRREGGAKFTITLYKQQKKASLPI